MMMRIKKRTFFMLSAGIALIAQILPIVGVSPAPKRSVLDTFSTPVAHAETPGTIDNPGDNAGCAGSAGGSSSAGGGSGGSSSSASGSCSDAGCCGAGDAGAGDAGGGGGDAGDGGCGGCGGCGDGGCL